MFSQSNKIKWKELVIISLISFILLLLLVISTDLITYSHPDFIKPWDHHKYIKMAESPFEFYIAPYCWRIIVPLIAFLLPFDLAINFLLIAFLSLWMSTVIIYITFRFLEYDEYYSFLSIIIFITLGWATKYNLHNFWLTDSLLFLFMLISIYCIVTKKVRVLILTLIVGVLVKETILLIIPLFYTLNANKFFDKKIFGESLFIVLPVIFVFIGLRILIPNQNENIEYLNTLPDALKLVTSQGSQYSFNYLNDILKLNINLILIVKYFIGTMGMILLVFPFFSIKENKNIFIKYSPFIIVLLLLVSFSYAENFTRLAIFSFFPFLLMSLNGIKILVNNYRISKNLLICFLALFYLGSLLQSNVFFHKLDIKSC